METLIRQRYLTNSLPNTNFFGSKNKSLPSLGLSHKKSLNFCSRFSSSPQVIKCVKTGSNSGPRNQLIEPLEARTTDTDLRVTIHSASMIVPLKKTERKSMFLTNIDQSVNIYLGGTYFFDHNPKFPSELIMKKLESAYQRLLVHYDFLAGRLRWNPKQGRLEIDCNSAGAGFIRASSKLSLNELGDLECPNPDFDQLATRRWDSFWPKDQPLFVMQVTSFKCGGTALGITLNHTTLDGIGVDIFIEHLASMAGNNNLDLPYPIFNNRHLLQARSPPRVTQPHVELIDLGQNTSRGYDTSTPSVFISKTDNLQRKLLHLTAEDIKNLKMKARLGINTNEKKFSHGIITNFNIVTAHIWSCMAMSRYNVEDLEKPSMILFPVNIRSRLRPRLPPSYVGNAIINGYGIATHKEIKEKPYSYLVEKVAEGSRRVKDEYVRSVIDWRELHNGYVHGDVLLTSWWRLGFGKVEFPWGKPKIICTPSAHQWSKLVLLLPDNREVKEKGVNVFVSLPKKELEKFQGLFYNFHLPN